MKTLLAGLIAFGMGVHSQAQQPAPMPVPNLTAKTSAASNKITRTNSGTERTAQSNRSIGVSVNVSFFTQPPAPYDVQCFFIAKDDSTGERYIFDADKATSQDKVAGFQFDSQSLAGGSKTWTSVPFSGTFSGSATDGTSVTGRFNGASSASSMTLGSKIEGWIVRVVGPDGKVVRMESNQPALKEMATRLGPALDKAATKIEKQAQ
jgi:hypothetical protein